MAYPESSIIIRAFNEALHLPSLFDALRRQTNRDFETIVVDSGSYDGSREIARREADHLIEIGQDDFTFGHSLNAGIRQAKGRFMAIISAHAAPTDPGWLEHLVAPLRDASTAMVYGRQVGDDRSKWGEFRDFHRTFGTEAKTLTPPDFFANNANAAIRRDLWELHPFDEALPGLEDVEWAKHFMQKGFVVRYEPRACIYHIHEESWPQLRRRYFREGQAARWIGVRRRAHLPGLAVREAVSLVEDLAAAGKRGNFLSRFREVTRFRYEKLLGTWAGIWSSARVPNPLERRQLYFESSYRAVVIRGPRHAGLESIPLRRLRPSEVLIRVAYQGVCGTDLEILEGSLEYYKNGMAKYPIVPGHELSGTVTAVGARAGPIAVGDRVVVECIQGCGYCPACLDDNSIGCAARAELGVIGRDGGYAEFVIVPSRFVHRLPQGLSLRAAALCEPLAVVLKAIRRAEPAARLDQGKRHVAIIGAGAIGQLTARVLEERGHHVTVIDRDPTRVASLAAYGITARDHLGDLRGFSVVVEATGNPEVLESVLLGSAAGTTIVLLGLPYARREFSFESIVAYDKCVIGSVGSASVDFRSALELLPRLDVDLFLQHSVPLEDFETAWADARGRRFVKTMIRVAPTDEEAAVLPAAEVLRRAVPSAV